MDTVSREQVMDALEQGWGTYVARFRQLTSEAQAASLKRQGYARLADVLAHVLAWWNEGLHAVEALQTDPGFASPDYDVDAFNAQAVQRSAALSEAAVVAQFEAQRQAWLSLVRRLPDTAFANPRLAARMHMELIGHLAEHLL
jgi:O-glycosyl hydrolase